MFLPRGHWCASVDHVFTIPNCIYLFIVNSIGNHRFVVSIYVPCNELSFFIMLNNAGFRHLVSLYYNIWLGIGQTPDASSVSKNLQKLPLYGSKVDEYTL